MNQQTIVNGIRVKLAAEQVQEFRQMSKGLSGYFCNAIESTRGYTCTCPEGHEGPHVAHDDRNFPLAVWDASHNFGKAEV